VSIIGEIDIHIVDEDCTEQSAQLVCSALPMSRTGDSSNSTFHKGNLNIC
jgi:hypothetical protein